MQTEWLTVPPAAINIALAIDARRPKKVACVAGMVGAGRPRVRARLAAVTFSL
jgi:hypothetical protein